MVASGGYCPLVACWLLVGTRSIDDSNRELVVRRIKSRLDLDLDIGRGGEGEERDGGMSACPCRHHNHKYVIAHLVQVPAA